LADELRALLGATQSLRTVFPAMPQAIIAPHAGYRFCGRLTAAAWNSTARCRPDRVVILSPSHKMAFKGLAVPSDHRAVSLPGLRVPLAMQAAARLIEQGLAIAHEPAFDEEHGIDTQLPFAMALHPSARVLPVVIGQASIPEVARLIDTISNMEGQSLFVLSSDLSHFLTLSEASAKDLKTAGLIELGQGAQIGPKEACGHLAIGGYLASNLGRGARALRLARSTSHAATQDDSRVVGYGAWALFGQQADILPDELRRILLDTARRAIASRLQTGSTPELRVDSYPVPLRSMMASFVTLEKQGRLRGCIGSMAAHRPLILDVAGNAVKAGFEDGRFSPLQPEELPEITLKISVLTQARPLAFASEDALLEQLTPGQTGLILQDGAQRATFLPSVWSGLPDPRAFLAQLKRKAGLAEDHWSATLKAFAYRCEQFEDRSTSMG
jgi:AmmeMemoRadiSam system protein A/AmmeMemoRadiSam system protein B